MSKTAELNTELKNERVALNELIIKVKMNKETNKSLIKQKRKNIARLLTKINASSEE